MFSELRVLSLTLALLCLNACASLSPQKKNEAPVQRNQLQSFAIEGRFSLHHEDKNYSGRLSWRHTHDKDELLIASPFGQGIAEIVSDTTATRLTASDGKVYIAADPESLTQEVLGYPLPLAQLIDWIRGRVPDNSPEVPDALGRPLRLRQGSWQVEYEYDNDDPQAAPGRLFIQRDDGLTLRLRIDEWSDLKRENTPS